MELETLKEKLRASRLHPIHVAASGLLEEDEGNYIFLGTLEEYLEAIRAIGAPIVLISTMSLEKELFLYLPEESVSEEQEGEVSGEDLEEIDLCSIAPALCDFKSHIGQTAIYKLSATLPNRTLNILINEPWWTDFSQCRESAVEQVDNDLEAAAEKSRAAQEAKYRDVRNSLRALIHDPDFVRLPTQKAMLVYAIDSIPELKTASNHGLRAEIQELHAQIKARGLDRKH